MTKMNAKKNDPQERVSDENTCNIINDIREGAREDIKTINEVSRELRRDVKVDYKDLKKEIENSESFFSDDYIALAKQDMKDIRKAIKEEAREIKREIRNEAREDIRDILEESDATC